MSTSRKCAPPPTRAASRASTSCAARCCGRATCRASPASPRMRSGCTSSTTRARAGARPQQRRVGLEAGRAREAAHRRAAADRRSTSASSTSKATCTCCRAPTARMSAAWRPTAASRRRSRCASRRRHALAIGEGHRLLGHVAVAGRLLPTIALVGRPNVGKSTLFNRLTKTRNALVADFPGLTRDRHYGRARAGEREFLVVDTGGFEPVATSRHPVRDGEAGASRRSPSPTSSSSSSTRAHGLAPQDRDDRRAAAQVGPAGRARRQQGGRPAARARRRRIPRARPRRAAVRFPRRTARTCAT